MGLGEKNIEHKEYKKTHKCLSFKTQSLFIYSFFREDLLNDFIKLMPYQLLALAFEIRKFSQV